MRKENGKTQLTTLELVYNFLVDFIKENGYSPSIKEICVGTNLSSKSSVHDYLVMLKMMGKIDMKENTPRSIRLVGYKLVKMEESA